MSDDLQYITRLMRIRCDKGTMDNYINVDRDHGVLAGGDLQPVLNANDHTKKNIIHCGNCESEENPERMFRKGLVAGLMGPVGFLAAGSVTDLLEDVGIMTCKCKPNTPQPWIFTNEDNILEGAPALTMKSKLACRYGGVISFVPLNEYPPEEPAEMAEEIVEETEEVPPAEDVVAEAVDAALEHAKTQIAETGAVGQMAVEKVQMALAAAAAMPPQKPLQCSCKRQADAINGLHDVTVEKAFSITDADRAANYVHNCAQELGEGIVDKDGMIINQSGMGNFLINNSTVAYSGCGAIALYNTIRTLNPKTEVTFSQTISWMEPYGVLNNSFGILPTGVVNALNQMGYETHYCFSQDAEEISRAASSADAAISLYATNKNIHYVAFHADSVNKAGETVFQFYNEKPEDHYETYEQFDDSLGGSGTDWNSEEPEKKIKFGSITILVNEPEEE